MKKYELQFYRNYYAKFEITIEANSKEEAMKKFENDEYKESDVTEPYSMQGGDDDFRCIVEKEEE